MAAGRKAWKDFQETGLHLTNQQAAAQTDKIIQGEDPILPKPHK